MDVYVKDRVFDSSRALNGNPNRPVIEMQTPISDIIGACLIRANVPFTYYVFDTDNNTFTVTEGVTTTLITIPPQTCNSNNLVTELENAFAEAGLSTDYVFYVDNTTSKLVIYHTGGLAFSVSFAGATAARDSLGFAAQSYSSQLQATLGDVYENGSMVPLASTYTIIVSPLTVNLSGPNQMYLHCMNIGPAMNGAITNDSNASDIIGDFTVNTNYQGTITYENPAPVAYDCQLPTLKVVQLYLTSGTSTTPIDLNGATFQAKIRFFCRKKSGSHIGQDSYGNRNVISTGAGDGGAMRSNLGKRALRMR